MGHFGQSTMLSGGDGVGVLDSDYESICSTARWEVQYWWPDRCFRRVKTMRLEWGRCNAPADPEQALDNSASMLAFESNLKKAGRVLLDELTAHGPGTFRELAARLNRNPSTMDNQCRRMVDMGHARVIGQKYELSSSSFYILSPIYGLPQHPDAPTPVYDRPSPVLEYLRAIGDWRSTRQLVAETGLGLSIVKASLARHRDALEVRAEKASHGGLVPFYRVRPNEEAK